MVISGTTTSKNHIELLVPVRSETGFVILGKFWSRFDLQQRRNRKFLGDDQGCLSEQTVRNAEINVTYRKRNSRILELKRMAAN